MLIHRLLWLLLFSFPVIGCSGDAADELTAVFGNSQVVDSIKNARSVSAYRLSSPGEYRTSLADYEMAAGPVEVPKELRARLQGALLDESTWGVDDPKSCIPDFGVRFQFQDNNDDVDVLLCFDCDLLCVYHNGSSIGVDDFDRGRGEFVVIVKALFPDDQTIQSLR